MTDDVVKLLTKIRLKRYLAKSNDDIRLSLQLYCYNTSVSESLYTSLQGLEICLRNSIDLQLIAKYGEAWVFEKREIFSHPQTEMIDGAIKSLRNDSRDLTRDRVISELSLGFWVGVLGRKYETSLWRECLRHAFPNRPKRVERKQIHKVLNAIRRLRNRVAHHEPILHRDLRADHRDILALISWMCPQTSEWVRAQSRFEEAFARYVHFDESAIRGSS